MTETDWLDALARLGPAATGVAALVALAVGIATVRQRDRADQRDQWWKRAQWALELTLSDRAAETAHGFAMLTHLAHGHLASDDERALLASLEELGLIRHGAGPDDESDGQADDADDEDEERPT